jgi:hypothetical protein
MIEEKEDYQSYPDWVYLCNKQATVMISIIGKYEPILCDSCHELFERPRISFCISRTIL